MKNKVSLYSFLENEHLLKAVRKAEPLIKPLFHEADSRCEYQPASYTVENALCHDKCDGLQILIKLRVNCL